MRAGAGAGEDGDLRQRVFARDAAEGAGGGRGGIDGPQHVVAVAAVHQQADQLRIHREGRAIRMVGGEEDAPGILDQQEQLQPDRPLQRVDEIAVAVAERHQAAAALALDVHAEPLARLGEAAVAVLHHGVAGGGDGLAEHDLADIDADMLVAVHGLGDLGRARRELAVALGAVAVELHVGEVQRHALARAHGLQGGLEIAGHAQIVAVEMQRMDDAQLVHGARQGGDDAARRDAVVRAGRVQAELAGVELEGADAAGIDGLHRQRLGRLQHPADIVVDRALALVGRHHAQQHVLVAEHDVAALVDERRVRQLGMGVAGVAGDHGRLEGGGVAHLGVAVAGDEGRGRGAAAAAALQLGALLAVGAMVLDQQGAREVDLAAADVAVHVDGAGHDDAARRDHRCDRASRRVRDRRRCGRRAGRDRRRRRACWRDRRCVRRPA